MGPTEVTVIGVDGASRTASDRTLVCGAIALAGLCLLWAVFSIHTASNWLSFPRFLAALAVLFILPGNMLLRWLRLPMSPVEFLTVATCLGVAATDTLYALLTWLGMPALLWIWLLAAILLALPGLQRLRAVVTPPRGEHALLLLTLIAVWLPILVIRFLGLNLSLTSDGGLTYFALPHDIALHAAIAGELTHTVPPQVPYVSGLPLSYHFGMDMTAAVLARFGGLSIADLVTRFCPLLFITIDALALFCLGRRFIGSGKAGAALAFLALLGEDFSFVPGLLQGSRESWDAYYFQIPTFFSLYYVNPMVMGLGFLFAGLFCLHRAMTEPRPGWFLAASLCLAALVEIKVFLFLQLGLSLIIVAALELALFRRLTCLGFGFCLLLLSLPLALFILLTNGHGDNISWTYASGLDGYVKVAFERMRLPALAALPTVALPLYLFCTFGFRVLGVADLARALKPARDHSFACLLAVFVVLGPLLTLTTKIVPQGDPTGYNNAGWFFCDSKFVATIFVVAGLTRLWPGLSRRWRLVLVVLLAAVSLPSSLEFVAKCAWHKPAQHLDPTEVAALRALDRLALPGQVVLPAMPGLESMLMTMTALRQPYVDYPFVLIDDQTATTRRRDVLDFRRAWAAGSLDTGVLARYGVSWIVAPHHTAPQVAVPRPEQVFDDSAITLYRVRQP